MDIVAKQWKQQLQYLLEGRDYESLIFTPAEDIPILPFYTAENIKSPYAINTKTQVAVSLFISDKAGLARLFCTRNLPTRFRRQKKHLPGAGVRSGR